MPRRKSGSLCKLWLILDSLSKASRTTWQVELWLLVVSKTIRSKRVNSHLARKLVHELYRVDPDGNSKVTIHKQKGPCKGVNIFLFLTHTTEHRNNWLLTMKVDVGTRDSSSRHLEVPLRSALLH